MPSSLLAEPHLFLDKAISVEYVANCHCVVSGASKNEQGIAVLKCIAIGLLACFSHCNFQMQ